MAEGILDDVGNIANGIVKDTTNFAKSLDFKTVATGAAIGAGIVGTGVIAASAIKSSSTKASSSRKKTRKRITHTKRGWKQDRARRSKQKWEVAYQRRKRKRRGTKRKHYTKNGQPYIILANGRAKFVKGRRKR